jgi:hypothetical protein
MICAKAKISDAGQQRSADGDGRRYRGIKRNMTGPPKKPARSICAASAVNETGAFLHHRTRRILQSAPEVVSILICVTDSGGVVGLDFSQVLSPHHAAGSGRHEHEDYHAPNFISHRLSLGAHLQLNRPSNTIVLGLLLLLFVTLGIHRGARSARFVESLRRD